MSILSTQNKLCSTETYPEKFVTDGWSNFAATRTSVVSGLLSEVVTKGVAPIYTGTNTVLRLCVGGSCLVWRLYQEFQRFSGVLIHYRVYSLKFGVPQAASPIGDYIPLSAEQSTDGSFWQPMNAEVLNSLRFSVA